MTDRVSASLLVAPATAPLVGSVPLPADEAIFLRALTLAALGGGTSRLRARDPSGACRLLAGALPLLGIEVRDEQASFAVEGRGMYGLTAPTEPIVCGKSPSVLAILLGVLSGQAFSSTLVSTALPDEAEIVVALLASRGATIAKRQGPGGVTLFEIGGLGEGKYLGALELEAEGDTELAKTAALFSGLFAHAPTHFREPVLSPDHTERLLLELGAPVRALGAVVALDPEGFAGHWNALRFEVPGDVSARNLLAAAAMLVPGSRVTLRGASLNPTRSAFLEMARQRGESVETHWTSGVLGEPAGDVTVAYVEGARAVPVSSELARGLGGDLGVAFACFARAAASTRVATDDVALRERANAALAVLSDLGVAARGAPRDVEIEGGARPRGGKWRAPDDPLLAAAALVLGLVAGAPLSIEGATALALRFPRLAGTLRALGADVRLRPADSP